LGRFGDKTSGKEGASMENVYDLLIVGGGPTGLSAAIYGGRARLRTLVLNKGDFGGQATTTREIVNYPGYIEVGGEKLMADFKKHAGHFGVEFLKDQAESVDFSQTLKLVRTRKGKEIAAKAVIIACGNEPRLLNIPGEQELKGMGVSYCATCDAEFFENQHVVVIGSGDQAVEEGMFISKFAEQVSVVVLHDEGKLDCNKQSAEKAFANAKMRFIWNSTVAEILGEGIVEGVKLKNVKTGEFSNLACQGVFFFVGMIPSTEFLKGSGIDMDKRGYIPVNGLMETNIEGVYAAGDNRVKYLRQVATCVGDGATASVAAERYIAELDDFSQQVLNAKEKVLLFFFNAYQSDSIDFGTLLEEACQECGSPFKLVKVDTATKKLLAQKYGIGAVPAAIILDKGAKVKTLAASGDKAALKQQLLAFGKENT
jgi:thioredoxin reductase (NADPH)